MITILGKDYSTYNFDEIKGKYYGFIYVTVNNTNGKMYVGMHFRWSSTYLGSGKILLNAIKRNGKSNFTRHIIDVAHSYEELIALEHFYIAQAFEVNCAKSPLFYNVSDKMHKSGSMSWGYLTEEERADRIKRSTTTLRKTLEKRTPQEREALTQRHRQNALDNYKNNPELRSIISKKTSEGMTLAVRQHLSKVKTGVSVEISEEERCLRAERMREIGKLKTIPWNKGISTKELIGEKISLGKRKYYTVLLKGKVIIPEVSSKGSYQGIADTISTYFNGKPIGKNNVATLIKTQEPYIALIPKKEFMGGLQIIEREGNEKRTYD